jgi:hypothetical protein
MFRHRQYRPQPGEVVYFIRAGDAVKIGRTVNVAARQRALATASAVPLELLAAVPGGRELEAQLHREWRHLHLRGEWFRADEELLRYIAELAGGGPAPEPDPRGQAQAEQLHCLLQLAVEIEVCYSISLTAADSIPSCYSSPPRGSVREMIQPISRSGIRMNKSSTNSPRRYGRSAHILPRASAYVSPPAAICFHRKPTMLRNANSHQRTNVG